MFDPQPTTRLFRPRSEIRYLGAVACVIAVSSALLQVLLLIGGVMSLPFAILGGGVEKVLVMIAVCVSYLLWSVALLRWGLRVWNRVPSSAWTVVVGFVLFGAMVVASNYFRMTFLPPVVAQGVGVAGVLGVFALSRMKEPEADSEQH